MSLPRPRVAANFAITWDGKTTTRTHSPTTYTSPADKQRLREIRAGADAVLAGASTVAADTMSMGLRCETLRAQRAARGMSPEPLRVIVTRSGRLDPDAAVFRHKGSPVLIFSGKRPRGLHRLPPDCDVHILPGKLSLPVVLAILRGDYGVRRLVCEGGPRLMEALLREDLVDEIFLTLVPRVFGGQNAPTLTGPPGAWLPAPRRFRPAAARQVGGELLAHFVRSEKSQEKVRNALRKH